MKIIGSLLIYSIWQGLFKWNTVMHKYVQQQTRSVKQILYTWMSLPIPSTAGGNYHLTIHNIFYLQNIQPLFTYQ